MDIVFFAVLLADCSLFFTWSIDEIQKHETYYSHRFLISSNSRCALCSYLAAINCNFLDSIPFDFK